MSVAGEPTSTLGGIDTTAVGAVSTVKAAEAVPPREPTATTRQDPAGAFAGTTKSAVGPNAPRMRAGTLQTVTALIDPRRPRATTSTVAPRTAALGKVNAVLAWAANPPVAALAVPTVAVTRATTPANVARQRARRRVRRPVRPIEAFLCCERLITTAIGGRVPLTD